MYVDLRRFIFLKSLESGLFTGVLKTFVGLREFYKWNPHNEAFGLIQTQKNRVLSGLRVLEMERLYTNTPFYVISVWGCAEEKNRIILSVGGQSETTARFWNWKWE